MAPVLNVLGMGATGAGLQTMVGVFTALTAFLLLLVVLLLCANCQGQKNSTGCLGDHANLMNGVPERDAFSQSVDSPSTDLVLSSSQNGPLTSGTVLTADDVDDSPQPSENMLCSQCELRSSKCPQDRELPSIPPPSGLEGASIDLLTGHGDGTYEMVKESSRDVSAEDSLYETVKEVKEPGGDATPTALNNGLSCNSCEAAALSQGVEYASVDLKKKMRYSADLEARRSLQSPIEGRPEEPAEEERPPPVPDKVLDDDENESQQGRRPAMQLENGEGTQLEKEVINLASHSSCTRNLQLSQNELSGLYSSIIKPSVQANENGYSRIGEMKSPSSSSWSDLYATVQPAPDSPHRIGEETPERMDPGYETIKILASDDKCAVATEQMVSQREPDYESVGDLEWNSEISRL